MLVILKEYWFVLFVALVLLFIYGVVVELMKPWILQRQREVKCQHAFKGYTHEHKGRAVFQVFFCPRCGARRMGGTDLQMGVIESQKKRPSRKQRRAAEKETAA